MYSCHGVSRTSLFLERFRSEFRIFFKSNKPVSKTYRPQNDNFCLLMMMSCSKSFKICFYGTGLKQFYKLHCNNNFLKEHRSKLLWAFNPTYWRWNLSLGHVYSRDTSIHGTPNSVQEKCSHNLCIYYPSIERTPLFRGKGQFFWARKPGFNLHSRDTLALKKWLTTES